jgi:predicted RNA-binding protein YlqC (UPF0109 family)
VSDSSPFQPPPFAEAAFTGDDELDDGAEDEDLDAEDDEDEDDRDDGDETDEDEDDLDDSALTEVDDEDEDDDDEEPAGNAVEGGRARAVLEHVARSIVDEPDAVLVEVGQGRSGVRLSLHVAPSDMGRIIGKRGRVAQAMRTVVRAAAASDGTDASVDIVD